MPKTNPKKSTARAVTKRSSNKSRGHKQPSTKTVAQKNESKPADNVHVYQKWWFWVIIAAILLGIIGASSRSNNNTGTSKSKASDVSTTQSDKKEEETPKVEVIDFSAMTTDQIKAWGEENSVKINFSRAYSDTVAKGGFIKQTPAVGESVSKNGNIEITLSDGRAPTTGEKNAVRQAESYLRSMSFSRSGLIHQLEYEGFTTDEATYAVDNITVNWNEQAAKTAASYLKSMAFSRDGLIHQLEYEGFTYEQAVYGVSQNGY